MKQNETDWKKLAVKVYESDAWVPLLANTLHPGGLRLTARMAELTCLNKGSKVLDLACGKGETAVFLVQEYGCCTIGLDRSQKLLRQTRTIIGRSEERIRIAFIQGDAETLPFVGNTFDVVFSECSFSLFPDKERTAREIKRVLKPGGKVIISDVIVRGKPQELKSKAPLPPPVAFCLCLAGVTTLEGYVQLFEQAGFHDAYIEDHSIELKQLAYRLLINPAANFLFNLDGARCTYESNFQEFLKEAKPGYALIRMSKF